MTEYVITFHTHCSAILTKKSFDKINIKSKLSPVPRELSSSCGTCLSLECEKLDESMVDEDFECVYIKKDNKYIKIKNNE